MDQVKMCGKCKKKVEKILSRKNKNMSGGYNQFYNINGPGDVTAQPEAAGGSNTNTPLPDNDAVKGFDKNNMPSYSLLGGGKGKKGKGKKQKGGCAGVCVGGAAPAPAAV